MSSKRPKLRSFLRLLLALFLVAAAVALWQNRVYVQDVLLVRQYEPSAEITAIAERASMSDVGTFYFYASHPTMQAASEFNQRCTRREPSSAILGCYVNRQIYLFRIDNPELDGMEEVTAAHEMLHAAWDRMSDSDRNRVGSLLEQAYQANVTDKLEERMAYYERTQPGERINELHSILGTEILTLSDELEAHYERYFMDRRAVVGLYDAYQQVFTELEQRAAELSNTIDTLSNDINESITEYNRSSDELNQAIEALNQRAVTLDRTDFNAVLLFNQDREVLLGQVAALESQRERINQSIAEHNAKLEEYNEIVVRSNQLMSSIDSLSPAPEL